MEPDLLPDEVDDPWKQKIILTLDGGGVRGFGSLLMLLDLMQEIKRIEQNHDDDPHASSFGHFAEPERRAHDDQANGTVDSSMEHSMIEGLNSGTAASPLHDRIPDHGLRPTCSGYLPCHYFDYIGGTSTGGLNAIMLGRLRMSVEQCVDHYPSMARRIFANPRFQIKGWPRSKYDARQLEEAIDDVVFSRTLKDKDKLRRFKSPDDLCRTFVVAKKLLHGNGEDPCIFRSYDNYALPNSRIAPITHGPASNHAISAIGRATAAAPTYFKPMAIGDDMYSDGGMGYNNPAEEGYGEVLHSEGHYHAANRRNMNIPIRLFLSIGTGGNDDNEHPSPLTETSSPIPSQASPKMKRKKSWPVRHMLNLGDRMQKEVVEANKVDRHMRETSMREDWDYIRWTGGKDLAKLKLDRWDEAAGPQHAKTTTTTTTATGTQHAIQHGIKKYMASEARRREVRRIARILVDVRRRRIAHDAGDRWQRYSYCSLFKCPSCSTKEHAQVGTMALLTRHLAGHNHDTGNAKHYVRFAPKVDGGPW